ncbi:hypothetical protein PVAND_003028 [Polypedilum vanderplanki]|uniref:Sphingomyelin phosphodiesterase n=1 Tax=Polypedilum vanderplanki TaxID=319348 RepID=A0A9J6BTP1_POLVA|nr:hypothetical protein PVAND_003028 [Polypedilum vanderplanki]
MFYGFLLLIFFVSSSLCSTTNSEQMLENDEERAFMEMFAREFENFAEYGYRSDKFNRVVKEIKSEKTTSRKFKNGNDESSGGSSRTFSAKCLVCRAGLGYLLMRRRLGDSQANIERTAIAVCKILTSYPDEVCSGIVRINMDSVIYIIDSRPELSSTTVCALIMQGECGALDKSLDFELTISPATPIKQSKSMTKNENKIKVLHISDIHYDPNYLVGGNANCNSPCCCRIKQGVPKNETDKAGYFGSYGDCDIPWQTVENSIKSAKAQHPDVEIIYYTGDFIDHGVWETSIEGNIGSMKKIYELFKKVFKNIPVYSILGNHEAQPMNVFAPTVINQEKLSSYWLYNYSASAWSDWLPSEALNTVREGGYYTLLIRPGLRLIGLNNNHCYKYNWWLFYSINDVSNQLQWLHDTLLLAEKDNEKVHMLVHIASGEGSCFSFWSREYRRIIEKFHNIISAQFNGHSHVDEFNVFYDSKNITNAINVAWNGGSVTTFSDLNPNYNVYWIDDEIFQVNEVESWIFNLTEANLTPNQSPRWYKQYSFKESFNIQDLSPASLDNLLKAMSQDRKLARNYFRYKIKDADPFLKKGCQDNCLKNHICEIVINEFNDKRKCNELMKNSFTSNDV